MKSRKIRSDTVVVKQSTGGGGQILRKKIGNILGKNIVQSVLYQTLPEPNLADPARAGVGEGGGGGQGHFLYSEIQLWKVGGLSSSCQIPHNIATQRKILKTSQKVREALDPCMTL